MSQYNYGRGSTAGGFMGNLGAFGAMTGGVNDLMAAIAPDQQPAQGPNTPVRNYPGMGYAPYGPGGGGLPPTPMPMPLGGLVGGIAGRTVAGMGNMGGLGLAGQIAGQFNDPITIGGMKPFQNDGMTVKYVS